MTTRVIDITPTWSALVPAIVGVLRNPRAEDAAVLGIVSQLRRMADAADRYNELVREQAIATDLADVAPVEP